MKVMVRFSLLCSLAEDPGHRGGGLDGEAACAGFASRLPRLHGWRGFGWLWSRPGFTPSAPDLKTKQGLKDSIGMYTVQCYKCMKWRKIPTKEEFKMIRESFAEGPWFCGRDPSVRRSCQQPEDISYDSNRIWVMDKPGIPWPAPEMEQLVIMRGDLSNMNTNSRFPNGKRVWADDDVEKFLQENPVYRAKLPVSKFYFITPKIVKETVGKSSLWRAAKAERERFEEMDMSDSDYCYDPSGSDSGSGNK